ncbi:hypothetical protein ABPG77_005748, partial [Micractinium sp. CCAP 211/92]
LPQGWCGVRLCCGRGQRRFRSLQHQCHSQRGHHSGAGPARQPAAGLCQRGLTGAGRRRQQRARRRFHDRGGGLQPLLAAGALGCLLAFLHPDTHCHLLRLVWQRAASSRLLRPGAACQPAAMQRLRPCRQQLRGDSWQQPWLWGSSSGVIIVAACVAGGVLALVAAAGVAVILLRRRRRQVAAAGQQQQQPGAGQSYPGGKWGTEHDCIPLPKSLPPIATGRASAGQWASAPRGGCGDDGAAAAAAAAAPACPRVPCGAHAVTPLPRPGQRHPHRRAPLPAPALSHAAAA